MKQSGVLIAACAVLLVGAWLASRALSADEVTPPPLSNPNIQTANLDQVVEPELPKPPSTRPMPKVDPQKLIEQVRSGQLQPVAQMPRTTQPELGEAPADEAENPFTAAVSPELDYADKLMWEVDGGIERLKSARDVYARCLEAAPTLQRCKDGLAAAEVRLTPQPRAVGKPEPQPTLKGEDVRPTLPTARPPAPTR